MQASYNLSYNLSPLDLQMLDSAAKKIIEKQSLPLFELEQQTKKLADKINYYKTVVNIAKMSFNSATTHNKKIEILQEIGKVYDKIGIGDFTKIFDYLIAICDKEKDTYKLVETYRFYSEALQRRGNFGLALEKLNKGIELNFILKDEDQTIRNSILLSIIYRKLKNYTESRRCIEFVMQKTDSVNYLEKCYNLFGIIDLQTNNFNSALQNFTKSKELAQELGDSIKVFEAIHNIGIVHSKFGNFEEAVTIFQNYADLSYKEGSLIGVGRAFLNLGVTFMRMKNYPEMVKCFVRSIRAYHSFGGNLQEKILAFNGAGSAFTSLNDFERAKKYYQKGLELAQDLNDENWVKTLKNKLEELKNKDLNSVEKVSVTTTPIYKIEVPKKAENLISEKEIEALFTSGKWESVKELLEQEKLNHFTEEELTKTNLIVRIFENSNKSTNSYYGMIGESEALQKIKEQIELYSDSDLSIIIEGETGTGKELVAKAIHNVSSRKDKPFLAIDCGAFTESLLTSELFGHKKGSFTGAISDKVGIFETADGGTLFLDEVANTSLTFQAKLLRVIQEGEVKRVGESTPIQTDVRIIVASNVSLEAKVREEKFRKDLYFRLNGETITTPTLKQRLDDLPLLFAHFYQKQNLTYKTNFKPDYESILEVIKQPNWEGNIRQLEHYISKAFIRSKNSYKLNDIKDFSNADEKLEAQKKTLAETLVRFGGNVSQTASFLQVSRKTLYKRLKKFNIQLN
ncbi:MAG: hypothetical protein DWQ06_05185 [Calditrichaeota bacterium]|nr:MAG: hypothetical protein DWQ06_05185 [Calditrichota bacterium]